MEVEIIANDDDNENKISFGLIDDDRLLGRAVFIRMVKAKWLVSLSEIKINKYYRGMNLGTKLLQGAELQMRELGVQRIFCSYGAMSEEDNFAGFLQKNGYASFADQYSILSYKLKEIRASVLYKKLASFEKMLANISTLEDVEPRQRFKHFEKLSMKEIDLDLSHASEQYTKLYTKNNELVGIVLCEKTLDEVRVQDYYVEEGGDSNLIFLALIGDVIRTMDSEKLSDETELKISVYHKNILNGIETSFGADHRVGVMKGFVKVL